MIDYIGLTTICLLLNHLSTFAVAFFFVFSFTCVPQLSLSHNRLGQQHPFPSPRRGLGFFVSLGSLLSLVSFSCLAANPATAGDSTIKQDSRAWVDRRASRNRAILDVLSCLVVDPHALATLYFRSSRVSVLQPHGGNPGEIPPSAATPSVPYRNAFVRVSPCSFPCRW